MSPQLMMGKKPSITDDIYALGATLYELLVGNPPFFTGNVMMQVLNKPAPDLNEQRQWVASENGKTVGDVSAVWVNTIMACLAKEAEDRPQSAREVWDRLTGTVTAPAAAPPAEEPKPRATVVGRATRSPFPTDDSSSHSPKKKSSVGLVIGGVALVAVLGAAGWWFGVEQPKREAAAAELVRIEEARIAAEELAAQAELV
jgi:serine/threonine protein kinase